MNEKSSRSHAIFSVSLKQEKWIPSTSTSTEKPKRPTSSMSTRSSITPNTSSRLFNAAAAAQDDNGEWLITTSKFHFVDLAGSERVNINLFFHMIFCVLIIFVSVVKTYRCRG